MKPAPGRPASWSSAGVPARLREAADLAAADFPPEVSEFDAAGLTRACRDGRSVSRRRVPVRDRVPTASARRGRRRHDDPCRRPCSCPVVLTPSSIGASRRRRWTWSVAPVRTTGSPSGSAGRHPGCATPTWTSGRTRSESIEEKWLRCNAIVTSVGCQCQWRPVVCTYVRIRSRASRRPR